MKITKEVNLKKYDNRKIYAPSGEISDTGGYVKMTDVIQTIKDGNTVKITHFKTGEDVTVDTLKNCVVDLEVGVDKIVKFIRDC